MNRRVSLLVMALMGIWVWAACAARVFGQVEKHRPEVLIERAARIMEKAALPSIAPTTRRQLKENARDLYLRAHNRLVADRDRLREELDKLRRIDDDDEKAVAAREQVKRELLRTRLLLPAMVYEVAKTYEPGSKESKDALTVAAEEFAALSRFDGTSVAGWYGRLWKGRCYRDLGQLDKAFEAFTEIGTLEDDLAAFRTLKHKAVIAHLETCTMPKLNEHAKAAKDARIWVAWTPKDQHATPGGLGIKYLGAEAMLRCIAAAEEPEAKRPETFHLARQFLLDVSKHPGEYQTKAKDRLAGKGFAKLLKRYPPEETENEPPGAGDTKHEGVRDQGVKTGTRPRVLAEIDEATTTSPELQQRLREEAGSWGLAINYKRVLAKANAAVRDNPKSAEAYRRRAGIKSAMEDHRGALKDVNVAIELDPSCADGYVTRGLIHGKLQRHGDARKDFDRALELDPTDWLPLAFRGKTKLLLGDLEGAIEDCYIVVRMNPGSWDTRLTLVEAYSAKGDIDNAMSCANLSIYLSPESHRAYRLRASLYARQGKIQKAIEDCTRSIELCPVDEDSYILRGDLFVGQKKYDDAIEDYVAAARVDPKSTMAHLKCGQVHFLTGNMEGAAKCRDLAIRVNPADTHPYRTRGQQTLSKGSRNEAIRCFSVSIALNPDDPEAYIARGNAFRGMGDMKKAAADFRKAEELKKGRRGP